MISYDKAHIPRVVTRVLSVTFHSGIGSFFTLIILLQYVFLSFLELFSSLSASLASSSSFSSSPFSPSFLAIQESNRIGPVISLFMLAHVFLNFSYQPVRRLYFQITLLKIE